MLKDHNKNEFPWIGLRRQGTSCQQLKFVKVDDEENKQKFRNEMGNTDVLLSTWFSKEPDILAPRNYMLHFHIGASEFETVRRQALEIVYAITECYGIPDDDIEIIYNGGGQVDDPAGKSGTATGRNDVDSGLNKAGRKPVMGSAIANQTGNPHENAEQGKRDAEDKTDYTDIPEDASAAEIVLIIPPVVFGGLPTSLMPALNYALARQMVEDGIPNIDIDVYQRDGFMALPNSKNSATGRYVIPLGWKELLYLDGQGLAELSKQPKPEDSMILPVQVPEAVDWFSEVHAEFEKKLLRQDELQKLILKNGWQIPPCIRRLTWADLDQSSTLEACRFISQAYAFLGSHEEEIWYHILRLARRNAITGFEEHRRLKALVTFAVENPMFECQHSLMARFCPAGWCFISELIEEYERPSLFKQVGERK